MTTIRRFHVCSALSLALLPATLFAAALRAADTNSWSLASPDQRCVISVSLGKAADLSYEVRREGKVVVEQSPLGLQRDDQNFEHTLVFDHVGETERRREQYELFAGIVPRVDHYLNHRSLVFRNSNDALIEIELAASSEGVAFRYHFTGSSNDIRTVRSESTGFKLPTGTRGWLQPYHTASAYTPAYEDFYFNVSPGELPPQSRAKPLGWCFPALFNVPGVATWVLLTESGTDGSYCASHLAADSSNRVYRIAFPSAKEATKGQTNQYGPEPRHTLPWTMPWRVMVMGKSAGDIAMATLVTDLAPPSHITDTSWIHPGRASWAWWSYPEGPATAERFDEFTDFAARMGWEYTLFDAGWWTPGLAKISNHARDKGVAPLAWSHARDFYDPEKRSSALEKMVTAGIRGVKVDFWCSDRQETMAAMQALFEEAAARRLLVNLHGCTIPRGWQRTWPNFLSAEAVLGNESYFYESRYPQKAAELNTVLPFTRNAVGPMDSTPVACSPKKYSRLTTAAHELATGIIFTSGLIHYADRPSFFETLPAEAMKVFRDAPARWDETRCLVGEPGRMAVFARRCAHSWFIAGINGTGDSLPVSLDLSPFVRFPHRLLITEGTNALMQVIATPLPQSGHWQRELPPRGGFILRMDE
ncbi:MAG: Retaining alpha-galactosidase precursor [Pedosphaera sp.]|nr:Retaining alpha-galactosidase precursor [Pedosphaera sp.]